MLDAITVFTMSTNSVTFVAQLSRGLDQLREALWRKHYSSRLTQVQQEWGRVFRPVA